MTVPSETSRSTYAGNGVATAFNTGFYFQRATQLRVTLEVPPAAPTVLTEGVHYIVTLPSGVGANGSITMLTPPASGSTLVIERDVSMTQDTSFRNQLTFDRATHEDAFDASVFRDQELDRRVSDLEALSAPNTGIAGDGLSVDGGGVWNVGQGAGTVVTADEVAVDFSDSAAEVQPTYNLGASGSPGLLDKAARIDHAHTVIAGNPVDLIAGATVDAGVSAGLALSDHRHGVPVDVPVPVTKAAAGEGVSTALSRSDHKHDVATAAAVELTDSTNAEGNATTLARSNHTHSHGVRGGGTLHALATTSTPGFMSAADKLKLDGLLATTELTAEVDTFTLTPTTLINFKPVNDGATYIDVRVVAFRMDNGSQAAGYGIRATVKNWAGGVVLVGQARLHTDQESTAAWDVTLSVSSPGVIIAVTGAADVPIRWVAEVRLTTAYI